MNLGYNRIIPKFLEQYRGMLVQGSSSSSTSSKAVMPSKALHPSDPLYFA